MWKFNGSVLTATFEPGATWPARSGGLFGNNPRVSYGSDRRALALENGYYRIIKRGEEKGPAWVKQEEMLIPGRKEGWFVPLEPQFSTKRGTLTLNSVVN
ncbi:MAG: hypothetical protein LBC94_03115 [Desulfovibrio sp.]|jgi:hypothetical protein|nr:hypothetical protein [Desulfovibrio sp.]